MMRIIGGIHRSRLILGPEGKDVTRPITARVKQSLFDRLWAGGHVEEGVEVLDIFSGTGSLGIEALSRGAEHCTFIERNKGSRLLLERNLAELGLVERATVMGIDALTSGWVGLLPKGAIGLAFCDPPYAMTRDAGMMGRVVGLIGSLAEVVNPGGVLMLRTEAATQVRVVEGWRDPETHLYGAMAVHLYGCGVGAE